MTALLPFAATMAIQSGCDIQTVARWLGHRDGGVLVAKTYSDVLGDHGRRMAAALSFKALPSDPTSSQDSAKDPGASLGTAQPLKARDRANGSLELSHGEMTKRGGILTLCVHRLPLVGLAAYLGHGVLTTRWRKRASAAPLAGEGMYSQVHTEAGHHISLPNETEPPMAWSKFLTETGISATTGWRWRVAGVISVVDLCGRPYVLRSAIRRLNERWAAGEFARTPKVPTRRSDRPRTPH